MILFKFRKEGLNNMNRARNDEKWETLYLVFHPVFVKDTQLIGDQGFQHFWDQDQNFWSHILVFWGPLLKDGAH